MRFHSILAVAASLGTASPVAGQPRSLDVPNDKGWQHAQTGIILMSKLGAFQRAALRDNGKSELDVSATYYGLNPGDTASIYLYRPGIANLPMWFDRSHYAMTLNTQIEIGAPLVPITKFARLGTNVESGLRVTYFLKGSANGGTGLAMVPFGDWILAVRLSSPTMSPAEVDAAMLDILAKIRWPSGRSDTQAAVPVVPCNARLKMKKAKLIPPSLGQALIGATLNNIVDEKAKEKTATNARPVVFCREGESIPEYAVYRSDQGEVGYVMALGDAGISASVYPGLSLTGRKEFAVTMTTHDSRDTYPSFDALPEPEQVFALVTSRGPMSRSMRGGNNIVIAPTDK